MEWIKVSERLPELDRDDDLDDTQLSADVLVCFNNALMDVCWYNYRLECWQHYDIDDEDIEEFDATDLVTHWMPLPQPPKD